jgi:uncharacterized repeat protein (TIGR01451 family)
MKNLFQILFFFILMIIQLNSHAQIFHEDFEIPDSVTYWSSGTASWGQNNRLSTSGISCDSASIQNNGDLIYMTTAPFSTIGMDSVILYFNHICKTEFFDGAFIDVSIDGGISWVRLRNDDGNPFGWNNCIYYGTGLYNSQGSKFSEASYATWQPGVVFTPENNWWKQAAFDISALLSNNADVRIRFSLIDQNNNGGNFRAGWFIDDILIADTLSPSLIPLSNKINGRMFVDMNSNLIMDAGETPVINRMLRQLSSYFYDFTNDSGIYQITSYSLGTVTVKPDPTIATHPYFNLVPTSQSATYTVMGQIDSLNDFALQPTVVANDLSIQITDLNNCKSTSSAASYWLDAYNLGSTVLSPTIVLYPSNTLSYVSSAIAPSFISTDSIVWMLGPLYPFEHRSFQVNLQKPIGLQIGTSISTSVKIEPLAGDVNTINNFNSNQTFICSAIDPNLIVVDKLSLTPSDLASAEILEYTIYFQNTGNDTATNVRINNLIPVELNHEEFELVANSHNIHIENDYLINPRLLTFTFDNIMLPDSTTNESESHGFIRYRIKPLSTLQVGDSILNKADIYFDFNAPITTNTAITEIIDPTSILENNEIEMNWNIYPNPSTNILNINFQLSSSEKIKVEIYNLYGQKIKTLVHEEFNKGIHQEKIQVETLSNGVYFIQLTIGSSKQVKKFVKVD